MADLSENFTTKMHNLLGEEYNQFIASLDNPPIKAVTINRSRLGDNQLSDILECNLSPIPMVSNGYYLDDDIKIGKTIKNRHKTES